MGDAGDMARRELGRYLRRARESFGWTLDGLAERLETEGVRLDPSTISRIEQGKTTVTLDTAAGLARCLGTSVAALEDVLRAARRRKAVDLTKWTFEGLIDAGKKEVSAGDIHAALDYFEAARDWISLNPEADDKNDRLAQALSLEARAHLHLRNYVIAHELTGRALNMSGLSADTRLTANLVQVMIGYYSRDFARAQVFAQNCEALLDKAAGDRVRAFGFAVLGDFFLALEHFDGAMKWLEKARDGHRCASEDSEVARIQVKIGYCLHKLGYSDNGLRIATEGLRRAEVKAFHEVAAFGLRTVGRILSERGDTGGASECFKKSQGLARRLGLAHDEFLAWYYLWIWSRRFAGRSETGRCVRAIRQLLPLLDRDRPEVQDFLASSSQRASQGRRQK